MNPSLMNGWRHYRLLSDYAAASPWLATVFSRSHVVEFPFDIGASRDSENQILPAEPWLPRQTRKDLGNIPGQRFPQMELDFTDTRPPYRDLIMLGACSASSSHLIYLQSIWRGSPGFEESLPAFYEAHRPNLHTIVTLIAVSRDKYPDGIPAVVVTYLFGLATKSSTCSYSWVMSVLDDVASRGAENEAAAFVAKETGSVSKLSKDIAEATYTRAITIEKQICGSARIPILSNIDNILLAELDHHCSLWGDTAITFIAAMSLLNTNNVVEQAIEPPPLNRAARRRGAELPPYRCHVLKVRPFGSRKQRDLVSDSGQLMPLHWVRGHFKTYTPERPLLGRFTGRFWFQPHLAGQDTERIVAKSYKVETTDSNKRLQGHTAINVTRRSNDT